MIKELDQKIKELDQKIKELEQNNKALKQFQQFQQWSSQAFDAPKNIAAPWLSLFAAISPV